MILSRRSRWTWNLARMKGNRSGFRILTGKNIGLRKPSIKWEDNIRIDLKEIVSV